MQWILDALAAHAFAAAEGWHRYRTQSTTQWEILSSLHGREFAEDVSHKRLAYTAVGIIVTVGGFVLANLLRQSS